MQKNNLIIMVLLLTLMGCGQQTGDPQTGVVRGEVSYKQRMAVSDDAVLVVQLEDVSLMDVPSTVLAEQRIPMEGRQVPIAFELSYPRSEVKTGHRYAVAARIEVGTALRFITTELHGVSLAEPLVEIDVNVDPVAAAVGIDGAGPTFACQGNEPFWSLSVAAESLEMKRLVEETTSSRFEGGYTALFGPDGGAFYEWQGNGPDQQVLKLRVLPGHCEDSMASAEEGGLFDYSGSVMVGDESLQGCCRMTSVVKVEPADIYECDNDSELAVQYREEGNSSLLLLQLEDGRELVLPEQISASGAKFSDGEIVFWVKEATAMLELDGVDEALHCQLRLD